MFSDSVIDRVLIQAFLETDYRVDAPAAMTLRVGVANPLLADLHKARRVESSAFITACNPFSQAFDAASNVERQEALARELRQQGLAFIGGIGQHPSNNWPGEPSFLVLGLSLEAAKALGTRHEQNAIIWCGADAVPTLVLLR